jgi:tRNA1Val (adenine37-N6)-methyltransferase
MQRTDTLSCGYKIIQDDSAFCFGIDAVLLSAFTKLKKGDRVFDLGCGNGILELLLSAKAQELKSAHRADDCHFTGLEVQPAAVAMARESVNLNSLENQIEIVEGNICEVRKIFPAQCADEVISNPPYMLPSAAKANSTDEKTIARHEVLCSLDDVVGAARWLLKSNGSFFIIHRPYRLQEIFLSLEKHHLTPRRMQFVYPKIDQPPEMVLIEARPNYKPDLKISPPLIMYGSDGEYTPEFKAYCGM